MPKSRLSHAKANVQIPMPAPGRPVVAFDFDGTLTVRDSFTAFLKWRAGGAYLPGLVRLAPSGLAYLGHRDRGRIKAAAVRQFLKGELLVDVEADARRFAEVSATGLIRPDALATWRWWRNRGAALVIVTASPETVVAPFARGLGADHLIGSRLACDADGRITGALDGENCRGPEKVARLRAMFGDNLRLAAAYGDTSGDREMLRLADDKGYKVFRAKP